MIKRRGFTVYLCFLVTTAIFMMVMGTFEASRLTLDIGRSVALETVAFHAADGGLERGLSRLRSSFKAFELTYGSKVGEFRRVEIELKAETDGSTMILVSIARVFEGSKQLSERKLLRSGIINTSGRIGIGKFVEA